MRASSIATDTENFLETIPVREKVNTRQHLTAHFLFLMARVLSLRILRAGGLWTRRYGINQSPRLSTLDKSREIVDLIQKTSVFVFDCDGVVWKGHQAIAGASSVIDRLRKLNKKLFFVTNNSTQSRMAYQNKFHKLGFVVSGTEILSSSFAAASYLSDLNFSTNGKKVYVIGEQGICDELRSANIPFLGGPEHSERRINHSMNEEVTIDPDIGAVVVGLDRAINYYKLQYGQLSLQNPSTLFIATNEDATAHCTRDQEWAAGGTMVGALKGCSKRQPIVVGKPSSYLLDYLVKEHSLCADEMCMVGDRLDTDILFGQNNGLKTLLVMSGVTTSETLNSASNSIIPSHTLESLGHLAPYLDLIEQQRSSQ
jgi:phosphoglycolate phosphatase